MRALKLEEYFEGFVATGNEDIAELMSTEETELEQILKEEVKLIKPGHLRK